MIIVIKVCFGGAVPGKGHCEVGISHKEDRHHCWTGSGLCGESGGVDDSVWDQGNTVHTEQTPELDLLLPKKLTELQTAITEMHHWEAEKLICPSCHRVIQHPHLKEEQKMCDGNALNINCRPILFLHFAFSVTLFIAFIRLSLFICFYPVDYVVVICLEAADDCLISLGVI